MEKQDFCILLDNYKYYQFRHLAIINGYFGFESSSYDNNNTYVTLELDDIDNIIINNILDVI